MPANDLQYVGFWARAVASLIDTVLLLLLIFPLLWAFYGSNYFAFQQPGLVAGPADVLISNVMPAVLILTFWIYKQATPGKMVFSAQIVDAATGEPASKGQLIGRYFAYIVSSIPLCLGFLWVAFDRRKQGWHDKLAGTAVVRKTRQAQAIILTKSPQS